MPTAFWTRVVIALATGSWVVIAYLFNVPVDNRYLKAFGTITMGVLMVLALFDLYVWRWLPFAITKRPKLRGTWKVLLESTWAGEGGEPVSKECYLVVRQTFSRVTVSTLFDVSRSASLNATITEHDGVRELSYVYWSAARTTARDGNPPHRGATALVIATQPKVHMVGDYWTERDNARGTLTTIGRSNKLYDSFEAALLGDYK